MVVRGDVLVKFGDGEWVWLLDGGDAQDAAQSAADPAYDSVGGRIRQPFLEVAIGNAGAVAIESAEGESRLGTFSEEGRERFGRRGKRSEEHTSELQSLMRISYAVFCLKKKKKNTHVI